MNLGKLLNSSHPWGPANLSQSYQISYLISSALSAAPVSYDMTLSNYTT